MIPYACEDCGTPLGLGAEGMECPRCRDDVPPGEERGALAAVVALVLVMLATGVEWVG